MKTIAQTALLAVLASSLTAAGAKASETEERLFHAGLSVGVGHAYDIAGARLELRVGPVAIFGAVGLPALGHPRDEGDGTCMRRYPDDSSFAGGIRYYFMRRTGIYAGLQSSWFSTCQAVDITDSPGFSNYLTFSGVVGYRWRAGVFTLDVGAGPALTVHRVGFSGRSPPGSPGFVRTSIHVYHPTAVPLAFLEAGVGVEF